MTVRTAQLAIHRLFRKPSTVAHQSRLPVCRYVLFRHPKPAIVSATGHVAEAGIQV